MAEIPIPVPESGSGTNETGYQTYIQQRVEALNTPENQGVYAWYKERVDALPEMETTPAPLTDGDKWKHTKTPEGEINDIRSGFFSMEGRTVKTPTFSWNQPGIIAAETSINLPTPEGNQALEVSGFVGIIRDTEGNVLLSVGQEPLAQTPKKALVRTPFQTSAAKLQGLLNGQRELDPNLASILEKVGNGRPITDMFATGEVETFPLAPADPNRIQATNIGFAMTVTSSEIRDSLTNDGKNRWCTPNEAKALTKTGVVNGHTAAVLLSTQ